MSLTNPNVGSPYFDEDGNRRDVPNPGKKVYRLNLAIDIWASGIIAFFLIENYWHNQVLDIVGALLFVAGAFGIITYAIHATAPYRKRFQFSKVTFYVPLLMLGVLYCLDAFAPDPTTLLWLFVWIVIGSVGLFAILRFLRSYTGEHERPVERGFGNLLPDEQDKTGNSDLGN